MISSFLDLFINRGDRGPTTSISLIKNIHRYEIVEKSCKEGIVDFYNRVVEEKEITETLPNLLESKEILIKAQSRRKEHHRT